MCVGVTVWFGWGGVVSGCRLKQIFSLHLFIQVVFLCEEAGLTTNPQPGESGFVWGYLP